MGRYHKPFDHQQGVQNLIAVHDILARQGVRPFLHFGTLLGAVREGGFIPYDDDIDLGIRAEDLPALYDSFAQLEAAGFTVEKVWENPRSRFTKDRIFKLMKDDIELDIFPAFPAKKYLRKAWDLNGRLRVASRFLDTLDSIDFLGHAVFVPHAPEQFLRILYGKNWRRPIPNHPPRIEWGKRFAKIFRNPARAGYFVRRFIRERWRMHKGAK